MASRYSRLSQTRDILGPGTTGGPITVYHTTAERKAELDSGEDFTPQIRRGYVESDEYKRDLDALYGGMPYDGCE